MECAICRGTAVGFCRHCHRALCREHLAEAVTQGAGGMQWSCRHTKAGPSASRERAAEQIRTTLRSVAKALSSPWPAAE